VSDRQRWEGTDPAWLRGLTAPRIGRRDLMRGAGVISLSALLAACGVKGTKQQAAPPDQVAEFWKAQTKTGQFNFANWPLYIDQATSGGKITHPTLDEFTKQTGIKVNYKEVIAENDPFLGKIMPSLQAGQYTGWDLIVITNGQPLNKLMRQNYLVPLDHSKLPNFAKYAGAGFKNPDYDPGNKFTLPWQGGITGIGYNPKLTGREITSFNDLFDPKFKGKVGMFGDTIDMPNLALLGIGVKPEKSTEADWRRAAQRLTEQRQAGIVRQYIDNDGEKKGLTSGDLWLSMAWSGDVFQLQAQGSEDLRFAIPKEGGLLWTDNMCIPAHPKHALDALTYMDYVYQPKVAAAMAEYINYITPVPAAQAVVKSGAAAASGEDKAALEQVADSPLVFPTASDLSNVFHYRVLTPEEEKVWNSIFEPVFQT
jgi:spermidine/putrescine transport system substrate-binding protein